MLSALYKASLSCYPLARRVLSVLPARLQNRLKRGVRESMAARNRNQSVGGMLRAADGRIEVEGLDASLTPGASVTGAIRTDSGLGVYARATLRSLELAHVPVSAFIYTHGLQHAQGDASCDRFITQRPTHRANIFCLNADMLTLCHQKSEGLFQGRYNIHYNAWELAKYPAQWMPAMNLAHEMWTLSTFMQAAAAASATIPVLSMGIAVECQVAGNPTRASLGLPEKTFLFLFSFDISSVTERKNPQAALRAFTEAFPAARRDVGLVVKINFIASRPDHIEKLRALKKEWEHDPRILFLDKILPRTEMVSLLHLADAYVSLHRAEGFGLGIAEAMLLRKPVIVTNYSGNTDFTRPHNACLVDYRLIPVARGDYIFEEGQVWADADVSHAAHYMRRLVGDKALCEKLGEAGHATIRDEFSYEAVGRKARERLRLLGLAA